MKNIFNNKGWFLSILLVFSLSCSKMNSLYDKYQENGETIYVGRLDSARMFPGRERIQLHYWSSDPRAAKMVVYWSGRNDSVLMDIPDHDILDPVNVMLDPVAEGNQIFEFITMNNKGQHRSVPYQLSASVYGSGYQSTLINRFISAQQYDTVSKDLTIVWKGNIEHSIGCEIEYTDTSGVSQFISVPESENITICPAVSAGLRYRTLFIPEDGAIDTFFTSYTPIVF